MEIAEQRFGYTILTGTVRCHDLGYLLLGQIDKGTGQSRSRVMVRDAGEWLSPIDLEWAAISCTAVHEPEERFVAMSREGYVLVVGGGMVSVEGRITLGDQYIGPFMRVRDIGSGPAYAVGALRQVYVREEKGIWRAIDESCRAAGKNAADYAFWDIAGFNSSEIYAVGWMGDIWRFDGTTWTSCKTPTKLDLYAVCCGGDGLVYAVGKGGILVRGRGNDFELLTRPFKNDDFWSCQWYNGRLFVASYLNLYEFQKEELKPVDFGNFKPPRSFHHLSVADGIMWSIGETTVAQLDSNGWSCII
jgi:hypothetical protein